MATIKSQERFKTEKGVFDQFTQRNLFELQSRNAFDELLSPLKIGKESNVFIGKQGSDKVIIKIYRIQNCDFKRMWQYIKKDTRYEFLTNKSRQIILAWVQREYKNLLLAQKAGVSVPKAISVYNNIIIEEFIGDEDAALPLKDALPEDPQSFFDETIENMKILYQAGFIHGDLSSFNILNYHEHPVFIDFSQGTTTKTPNSEELLGRDVRNIVIFFRKLGVKTDEENVLRHITEKTK